uniref:Uncharacterized protein n=1 Tax=Aegilops tauschii subsp. strangulata TaxID=200361 RepID=A0A453LKH3_AEGTS
APTFSQSLTFSPVAGGFAPRGIDSFEPAGFLGSDGSGASPIGALVSAAAAVAELEPVAQIRRIPSRASVCHGEAVAALLPPLPSVGCVYNRNQQINPICSKSARGSGGAGTQNQRDEPKPSLLRLAALLL